jgi:hypothetical protein
MTTEQAIEEVRRVGSLAVTADGIRYEIRNRGPETARALAILKERKSEAMTLLSGSTEQVTKAEQLESVLKGQAIELWSTAAGRLFLVADEADTGQAMERFGARRGEIYTAAEARRIIAVKDPAVVAEIHDWKRRFDGVVREFRAGDQPE